MVMAKINFYKALGVVAMTAGLALVIMGAVSGRGFLFLLHMALAIVLGVAVYLYGNVKMWLG